MRCLFILLHNCIGIIRRAQKGNWGNTLVLFTWEMTMVGVQQSVCHILSLHRLLLTCNSRVVSDSSCLTLISPVRWNDFIEYTAPLLYYLPLPWAGRPQLSVWWQDLRRVLSIQHQHDPLHCEARSPLRTGVWHCSCQQGRLDEHIEYKPFYHRS